MIADPACTYFFRKMDIMIDKLLRKVQLQHFEFGMMINLKGGKGFVFEGFKIIPCFYVKSDPFFGRRCGGCDMYAYVHGCSLLMRDHVLSREEST